MGSRSKRLIGALTVAAVFAAFADSASSAADARGRGDPTGPHGAMPMDAQQERMAKLLRSAT